MQKDGGRIIRIKTETYDRLNSLGKITSSFDSVITDLIEKATVNGGVVVKSSAGAALNKEKQEGEE